MKKLKELYNTLLPCPFCGKKMKGEDSIMDIDFGNTTWFGVMAQCECGAKGKEFRALPSHKGSEEKAIKNAIEFWNNRA